MRNCHSLAVAARAVAIGWVGFGTSQLRADPPSEYSIASFGDEFNDTIIDPAKWNTGVINYPSGNTWLYRNHPGNNTESGGYLRQTTLYQDVTGDGVPEWTCSSVSASRFRQRFGYWECRMKITQFSYTDANFWSTDPSGVHLNGMDGFEIDGPEAWGPSRYTASIYDHNTPLVHTFEQTIANVNLSQTFNTYGFEWATDNSVNLYFNGTLLKTFTPTQMNAVEGLIPQSPVLGTALWTTGLTASNQIANGDQKQVDWVRVYQKPGWTGATSGTWNNAANWGADGVPGSGRAAVFNTASANRVILLSTDQPVQELTFQTSALGAATINGPGRLLLGATTAVDAANSAVGGININNDATGSVTVNADILAQRKLQFSNFSGTTNFGGTAGVELVLNGGLNAATASTPINFLTTGPIRVNGVIGSNIGTLTKGGQGTVYLNAANAFTGEIDHRNGQIIVNANGALGTTTAGVNFTATSQYGSPALVFGNVNYTLAEPLTIQGTGNQGNGYAAVQGAIDVAGTNTVASFAGPISLSDDATIASGRANQNASLTLSGTIDVADHALTLNSGGTLNLTGLIKGVPTNGTGQIIKTGSGLAVITGNNTAFKGTVLMKAGTLSINSINALGGGTGNILQFDGGTLLATAPIITGKGGSFSANQGTLNTNGNSITINGPLSGDGGFTKTGTGTLALNGANTFSGTAIIKQGTLATNLSASNTLLDAAHGGIDLQGGDFLLNYGASGSPIVDIKSILDDAAKSRFASGQIRSTTLPANRTLGYLDNGTSAVLVRITLPGDADLDGDVDFNDFLRLQNRFSQTATRFDEGNFNYDAATDFNDFLILQNNFGQSISGASVNISSSQIAAINAFAVAVPEPAFAGILAVAAAMLTARHRRQ